jgi:hypothetical protein
MRVMLKSLLCISVSGCISCEMVRTCHCREKKENLMKYERLIERIASRNPPPMLVGEEGPSQLPRFPKDYDWKDQRRVLDAVQDLVDHAEEARPTLIDHIDDQPYSLTFKHDMSVSNETVGDVCFLLLFENLTAAFLPYIPDGKDVYNQLHNPDIIPDDGFQEWCRKRLDRGQQLYEVQIEMCEWAMKKIATLKGVTVENKNASVSRIKKEIDKMRLDKKPVLIKSIIQKDARTPYSQEQAERIREKIDATANKPGK